MRRRSLLAAALLAAPLASCSRGPGEGNQVFRQLDPLDQAAGLPEAVSHWNHSHPKYEITLQTLSPNNPQQFAREANSGSGPDICQLAFADISFLAEPRLLTTLDSFLQSSPAPGSHELLATDMTTYRGKMWAIPWTVDTNAMVFRPDIFEKYGIKEPPTDWNEFADATRKISTDSHGKVNGFLFTASGQNVSAQWFIINYYLWCHDCQLIKKTGDKWQIGLTQEQLTDTFNYFNSFFTDKVTPTSMQAVSDNGDPSFIAGLHSGTCATTLMPPNTFKIARDETSAKLMTAPAPGGLKDGASHLGGRALGINANCAKPEAAWEFVKSLMKPETFTQYQQYPASADTLTKIDADPTEQGYIDQLPHARSFARYADAPITLSSMQATINQQSSAVFSGQYEPAAAADRVLSTLDNALKEQN